MDGYSFNSLIFFNIIINYIPKIVYFVIPKITMVFIIYKNNIIYYIKNYLKQIV